jgi:hypothetical protein
MTNEYKTRGLNTDRDWTNNPYDARINETREDGKWKARRQEDNWLTKIERVDKQRLERKEKRKKC